MSLSEVIVEYCTCHVAVDDVLNCICKSINTYKVDIFANSSSSCLDCL